MALSDLPKKSRLHSSRGIGVSKPTSNKEY